jgi:flagella basal body P-ring formation protein FlgA
MSAIETIARALARRRRPAIRGGERPQAGLGRSGAVLLRPSFACQSGRNKTAPLRNLLFAVAAIAAAPLLSIAAAIDSNPSAPTTQTVSPAASSPLAQDAFVTAVTRDLAAHFNLEGELQLELLRPWTPPDRVARDWQVQMAEYPTVPSSSMLVRCRVLADGASVADQTLVLRAALWRDVWVARQPLDNGAAFDAALLDARRVDLFRERDALPATVGDRTFVFARSVQAGRTLTWRDIARRPLVRKGEVVEVSANEGQLVITMKALAMQNGAQGEAITVRNLESRKDFTAFVVDENRVQVRF